MSFYSKYKYQIRTVRRTIVLLLLYPPLLLVIFIFRLLPIGVVRKFAQSVGRKYYRYAKNSRQSAKMNLDYVYGSSMSNKERNEIVKASFVEVIKSFFDYMSYSKLTDKKKFFDLIEVKGEEHLRTAYERGKGVICLIPHMSSWEFAATVPPMLGYPTSAASKSMKLSLLEKLMIKFRSRKGLQNITREGSYGQLVEILQKGECLILMTDQDTLVRGVFVDFLGKVAYTPIGASRLLQETDAVVVPMCLTRKKNQNYRFTIYPPLETVKTDDIDYNIKENTRRQNEILGQMITKHPKQWVWMHRRWKTTPEVLAQHLENRRKEKEKKREREKNLEK